MKEKQKIEKKRNQFIMAEAKVRNIIEASTTEINDSINFNRRVYSTRGH